MPELHLVAGSDSEDWLPRLLEGAMSATLGQLLRQLGGGNMVAVWRNWHELEGEGQKGRDRLRAEDLSAGVYDGWIAPDGASTLLSFGGTS